MGRRRGRGDSNPDNEATSSGQTSEAQVGYCVESIILDLRQRVRTASEKLIRADRESEIPT